MRKSVVVERTLPTDPQHRASASLYLSEGAGGGDASPVTTRRMLKVGVETVDVAVAERFGIKPGSEAFVRRKMMFADGVSIRIATSFFEVGLVEGTELESADFMSAGLQEVFERMGLEFGSSAETLVARTASEDESELLDLGSDAQIVVEILRSSYDTAGNHVHTLQTICAATRHIFRVMPQQGDRVF